MVIIIYQINSYKFGEIEINDNIYHDDVIIYPDKLNDKWWRNEGHRLHVSDIKDLKDYNLDTIVIGTGASEKMKVDPKLKEYFDLHDIDYYISNTKQAVQKHNELSGQDKIIITALHLTC